MKTLSLIFCLWLIHLSVDAAVKYPKKTADHWTYIPSGTLRFLNKDSASVKAFWMFKTEVTNLQYREFLAWTKKNGTSAQLVAIMPDTTVWLSVDKFMQPMVKHYLSHPAYDNYPVVGVSNGAAKLYCAWLTDVYNTRLSELFPKLDAKSVEVRLPSEEEWMWAAKGGHDFSAYPWGGPYLRNVQGEVLCNVLRVSEARMSRNLKTGEVELKKTPVPVEHMMPRTGNVDLTAPVFSYWPNDYGLYNMAGNVAEMLSKPGRAKGGSWYTGGYDAQIESPDPNEGNTAPTSFIGFRPVFTVVPR